MPRLPQPGQDNGTWGELLNEYLSVELDSAGNLKLRTDGTLDSKANDSEVVHLSGSETIAGLKIFSTVPTIPAPSTGTDAANKTYVDNTVASGTPDATGSVKGKIQLAGDLTGTAASPTIANGAVTAAKVAADVATQAELDSVAQTLTANTQTTSYVLVAGDAGKVIEMNSSSATTVTIPLNSSVAFATGTVIEVLRFGTGTVTITPTGGVTIRSRASLTAIANQYGSVSLRKRATDEWVLVGDLT
ncbi:hypothetical protein EPO04_01250 [Patescibacteria group bacterium]|nr:MAG: hypothetical protein EPO04_01250 [Patescibacteria group bacterium]